MGEGQQQQGRCSSVRQVLCPTNTLIQVSITDPHLELAGSPGVGVGSSARALGASGRGGGSLIEEGSAVSVDKLYVNGELFRDQESSPPLSLYFSADQDIKSCSSECLWNWLIGEEVHLGADLA